MGGLGDWETGRLGDWETGGFVSFKNERSWIESATPA